VELAKRVATLDTLSKGRVRLCVGVGWMREEIEACGTDFATRGRRADEAIDVMRMLWAEGGPEGASFEGEFFSFKVRTRFQSPAREGSRPHRGHSDAAARRAAEGATVSNPSDSTGAIRRAGGTHAP